MFSTQNRQQNRPSNSDHFRDWEQLGKIVSPTAAKALAFVAVMLGALALASPALAGWEPAEVISGGSGWGKPRVAVKGPWVHVVWTNDEVTKLMYRRSSDGGRSWEPIRQVYSSGSILEPRISVSDENVHIVFRMHSYRIMHFRSHDNGDTFIGPTELTNPNTLGYEPEVAAAEDGLFVIWIRKDPNYDILFRRSFDNGVSWDPLTQNLTSKHAPPNREEMSARIAAGTMADDNTALCIVWVEVDWPDVWAYASYSISNGDQDTWTWRYPLWHEQNVDWRSVAIAATGGPDFHATRGGSAPQGPLHRYMNPFSGQGWSNPVSIGNGGGLGEMDGSRFYTGYATTIYSREGNILVSTGPGTETNIGSGARKDIAANDNGNMHTVWDSGSQVYYRRYLELPRGFDGRGKPYPLKGLYLSDAQWGDLDGDGDLDVVVCGEEEGNATLKTVHNHNGALHFHVKLWGVQSTGSGALALGDYDNDGDLDLAAVGTDRTPQPSARVYNNDGTGLFTWDTQQVLTGVSSASVAWGDYDGDGDLDLYLQGYDGDKRVAILYENDPVGTLKEDTNQSLTGLTGGSADWGDWDGDDDLDLVVTGHDGANPRTIFYENDPVGTLTNDGNHGIPGVYLSDTAWGDYDNDGDLDLGITGNQNIAGNHVTRIYENDGAGGMTQAAGLKGLYRSSCAWGDYDNDGDMDFASCGYDGGGLYTRIYENTGGGFAHAFSFDGVREGSVSFADVEDDGNLDFFLTGSSWTADYADQYANIGGELNTPPSEPTDLDCQSVGGLQLTFSGASDAQTPAAGLYYCLRVGTSSGANDVVSGTYGSPLIGNVHQATGPVLNVPSGTYYWSVRTVDSGLMTSSDWSQEKICDYSGPCTGKETLKAKCTKNRKGVRKLKATLKKGQPNTAVTFRLDRNPGTDVKKTTNNKGKAKLKTSGLVAGPHVLEIVECPVSKNFTCP